MLSKARRSLPFSLSLYCVIFCWCLGCESVGTIVDAQPCDGGEIVDGNCIPYCTGGAIESPCTCAGTVVTEGYCCSNVIKGVDCAASLTTLRLDGGLTSGTTEYDGKIFSPLLPHLYDGVASDSTEGFELDMPIADTEFDSLYQKETWVDGWAEFRFIVQNGDYSLHLHFVDWPPTGTLMPGDRLFHVDIQGERVLTELDIIAEVGKNAAMVKSFDLLVTTGEISLTFTNHVRWAEVAAIEIVPQGTPHLATTGCADHPCGLDAECVEQTCVPHCSEGEVGIECICGATPAVDGYCCSDSHQNAPCDLPVCDEGTVTSQCNCGGFPVDDGFCCSDIPQQTLCPPSSCNEGAVLVECMCGDSVVSAGYCCFETHQTQACNVCEASVELCNGVDDDCNSLIDEGSLCADNETCRGVLGCRAVAEAVTCPSGATCIYVDPTIADCTTYAPATRSCGSGTAVAYDTIQKGADIVSAGDYLLIREGIHRESVLLSASGTAENHITIAAYASENVIIEAADPISGWMSCTSQSDCGGNPNWQNIYKATPGFAIQQLFQDNRRLSPSVFPEGDHHWEQFSSISGSTVFYDSSLSFPDNYFVGATVAIKHWPWHVDFRTITNSDADGRIAIDSAISYPWDSDDTYYIFNIVPEIDDPGEWAYDASTTMVYLWPENGLTNIQASRRDTCIETSWNQSYIDVIGLTCLHANSHGFIFRQADHVTLRDSTANFSRRYGVFLSGDSTDVNIIGNAITYSGAFGITDQWAYSKNLLIEGNYIYASGAETFAQRLFVDRGMGIQARGENVRILHNTIEKTGANGIFFRDDRRNNEIAYNYIKDTALSLTDQGAIYTDGLSETGLKDHIHHNIIEDVHGYSGGFYDWGHMAQCIGTMDQDYESCSGSANAIYNDEQGNDFIFEKNTIINAPTGVFFHWAPASDLIDNVFYANRDRQGVISGTSETASRILRDLHIEGNVFFCTTPEALTFRYAVNYSDLDYGYSDYNYYYQPYATNHMSLAYPGYSSVISLSTWQDTLGKDSNSREIGSVYVTNNATNNVTNNADNSENADSFIIYNKNIDTDTVSLGGSFCDLDGNITSSVTLEPFTSQIFLKCFCNNDGACNNHETSSTCPSDC